MILLHAQHAGATAEPYKPVPNSAPRHTPTWGRLQKRGSELKLRILDPTLSSVLHLKWSGRGSVGFIHGLDSVGEVEVCQGFEFSVRGFLDGDEAAVGGGLGS